MLNQHGHERWFFMSSIRTSWLSIGQSALFQHLTETITKFEVTLALGTLQKLFHVIEAGAILLQPGSLRLLVSDVRPWGLSTASPTEAPSDDVTQSVALGRTHSHLGHQTWLLGNSGRGAKGRAGAAAGGWARRWLTWRCPRLRHAAGRRGHAGSAASAPAGRLDHCWATSTGAWPRRILFMWVLYMS